MEIAKGLFGSSSPEQPSLGYQLELRSKAAGRVLLWLWEIRHTRTGVVHARARKGLASSLRARETGEKVLDAIVQRDEPAKKRRPKRLFLA